MSVYSPDRNLHTPYKSNGKRIRKSLSFSFMSKFASRKWKANNLQLARENARLKKDIQKWTRLHVENALRYDVLEMSWRHRGETLSKIGIMSRMVGNQIREVMSSIAEIQSACQEELSVLVGGGAANNAELTSHRRHTVPNMKIGRARKSHDVSRLSSKSQLINHVNPMVSGHPIIKPTITLQRLNLQDVPSSCPLEQVQSPLPRLDEGKTEEVHLSGNAENTTGSSPPSPDNSDEEECLEIPVNPSTGRMAASSSSPLTYHNIVLPVAEVPLERLSLSRILDRHEKTEERNVSRGMILQDNEPTSIDSRVNATSRRSSVATLSVQSNRVRKIGNKTSSGETSPLNTEYCVSRDMSPMSVVTKYASRTLDVTSSTTVPNSISVKKYAPSSCTKSQTSFEVQKSRANGVSEKYRLVVALQDVSSYLHNGTLTSIEQLKERNLKAVAGKKSEKQSSKRGHGDLELSMSDQTEDQTQLNFTAEIGTLDYTSMCLNDFHVEGRRLSAKEDFLNRIQSEDPLEGSSWHFQNVGTPTIGKRMNSKSLHSCQSSGKENSGSQWNVTYVTPKKDISSSSQHQQAKSNHEDSKAGKGSTESDEDMDMTECLPLYNVTASTFSSHSGKETKNHSAGCKMQSESMKLCAEMVTLPYTKKPRMKYNNDAAGIPESENKLKPSENAKKNQNQKRAHSARTNSKSLSRNKKTGLRAAPKEAAIDREQLTACTEPLSMSQSVKTFPLLEYTKSKAEKENVVNPHCRSRRKAAPTNLREASLITKMRRDSC